ncbi:hypothetical protein EGW08_009289 [Elysia chlorotica]|uniref:Uncharacterized protein n=1 Tax=Elysia chlorotica TaxID=188477 RepID=A0A3S1BG86_ELYCH|nr:hypothetical protein EGW08_009289 [Elysia chlorotica]
MDKENNSLVEWMTKKNTLPRVYLPSALQNKEEKLIHTQEQCDTVPCPSIHRYPRCPAVVGSIAFRLYNVYCTVHFVHSYLKPYNIVLLKQVLYTNRDNS